VQENTCGAGHRDIWRRSSAPTPATFPRTSLSGPASFFGSLRGKGLYCGFWSFFLLLSATSHYTDPRGLRGLHATDPLERATLATAPQTSRWLHHHLIGRLPFRSVHELLTSLPFTGGGDNTPIPKTEKFAPNGTYVFFFVTVVGRRIFAGIRTSFFLTHVSHRPVY
jgi:hypothetical protein